MRSVHEAWLTSPGGFGDVLQGQEAGGVASVALPSQTSTAVTEPTAADRRPPAPSVARESTQDGTQLTLGADSQSVLPGTAVGGDDDSDTARINFVVTVDDEADRDVMAMLLETPLPVSGVGVAVGARGWG